MTDSTQITILIGKKGNVTVKKKQMQNAASGKSLEINLDHNRKKRYVLEEGKPVDFLVELGVMMPNGQVVRSWRADPGWKGNKKPLRQISTD